jgi:hypothetical protein
MRKYLSILRSACVNFDQIELVASFCSLRLHRVPRVADIEHEV